MTGCSSVLPFFYGFKSFDKEYNKEQVFKTALSWGIPQDNLYFLKKEYLEYLEGEALKYGVSLSSCDSSPSFQMIKNHSQPLQIMFFNNEGNLVTFLTNCYCGGFPNFKWNRNHCLDSLPATQVTPLDTLFTFDKLITLIHDIDHQTPEFRISGGNEYSIVVFWETHFGRQSKRLIKQVERKYGGYKAEEKVEIFYVNSDVLFVP